MVTVGFENMWTFGKGYRSNKHLSINWLGTQWLTNTHFFYDNYFRFILILTIANFSMRIEWFDSWAKDLEELKELKKYKEE